MHKLSDAEEDILESLWIETQDRKHTPDTNLLKDEPAFKSLIEKGLIDLNRPELLTEQGFGEAALCCRRHRLAERLLVDIFDVKDPLMHEAGCKFEHGLHHGLEDNVCTLLGHPRRCPHGRPIPMGECCRRAEKRTQRLIVSLKELSPGDYAKISYINTQDKEVLNKLIAMGILPGNTIRLLHRFPSFVFEMENSSFAVDEELAENIHVLVLKPR